MILPNNGKVVIIDDKVDDVIDLMSGLSASSIPFVYYKDEFGDDLPVNPLDNVRLIFLDLLLIDDNQPPVKKVISTIISRLKRIISVNNGPYVLIYWSSTRKIYGKLLEKELNKKALEKYKPFAILNLTKPSSMEVVIRELSQRFDKFKSLKAFFLFESLTNKVAGNVVNNFANIFALDGNWDKNLKDVLYKTGEARIGKDNFSPLDDAEKIKNSLLTISSTIEENMEKVINECNFSEINFDPLVKYNTTDLAKAKLHSKLHIIETGVNGSKSGNVYFLRNNKKIFQEILTSYSETGKDVSNVKITPIFLDLTPACDYSQSKKYVRGVYGIILNETDFKLMKIKKPPAYIKSSPSLFIENEIKYLILDYRFADSVLLETFLKSKRKFLFKLSNELLNEFQVEFAKHINRPGYTSLN